MVKQFDHYSGILKYHQNSKKVLPSRHLLVNPRTMCDICSKLIINAGWVLGTWLWFYENHFLFTSFFGSPKLRAYPTTKLKNIKISILGP